MHMVRRRTRSEWAGSDGAGAGGGAWSRCAARRRGGVAGSRGRARPVGRAPRREGAGRQRSSVRRHIWDRGARDPVSGSRRWACGSCGGRRRARCGAEKGGVGGSQPATGASQVTEMRRTLTPASSPVSSPSKHGDRFIPSRAGANWSVNFHRINENEKSPSQNRKAKDATSDNGKDGLAYSALLKNELLGAGIEKVQDPQTEDRRLQPSTPEKKGLFTYSLSTKRSSPDDGNDVSPYSLSPVSNKSQKLLRSPRKPTRKISKIPFKVLDAPELQDDFYLNLVDWSSLNVLSVGLGTCVYLWSACTSQVGAASRVHVRSGLPSSQWPSLYQLGSGERPYEPGTHYSPPSHSTPRHGPPSHLSHWPPSPCSHCPHSYSGPSPPGLLGHVVRIPLCHGPPTQGPPSHSSSLQWWHVQPHGVPTGAALSLLHPSGSCPQHFGVPSWQQEPHS
uniref:Fizzy and cell division cycle 20 related 1 n=1 Tax=Callithrix jacchus TaxID=9483 RepID=A0A8I3WHV9_CALJA